MNTLPSEILVKIIVNVHDSLREPVRFSAIAMNKNDFPALQHLARLKVLNRHWYSIISHSYGDRIDKLVQALAIIRLTNRTSEPVLTIRECGLIDRGWQGCLYFAGQMLFLRSGELGSTPQALVRGVESTQKAEISDIVPRCSELDTKDTLTTFNLGSVKLRSAHQDRTH